VNPPYPEFPKYPPGDPRNAAWEARLRNYNARVEESNRRFCQGVRDAVCYVLLACLFAIWQLLP
jgi:hypothetical protein